MDLQELSKEICFTQITQLGRNTMKSMGNKRWRFVTALVGLSIVIALILGACSSSPVSTAVGSPTFSPTPTLGYCNSKLLPGHLLMAEGNGVHELTCAPAGTLQDKVLPDSQNFNSISPDGRFLHYVVPPSNPESTTFEIVLQDLQTGAKHTYQLSGDKDSSSCVSWSPSGTQVSYNSGHAIILENLTSGASQVLVQEPSQNYALFGVPPGQPYFGAIDCGAWISDDIMLFHRFTGDFPTEISTESAPELAANTTTLALLHNGTFVDSTGASLEVSTLSQDGKYVLLTDTKDNSWNLAKVSDFTSFKAVRPITCTNCTLLGFVPHSDQVFGYQYDSSSMAYKGLVFVNPQDLTAQLGPSGLPAGTNIRTTGPTGNLEVIQWGGTPDNAIVVYEYADTSKNQDYYAVSSLQSGEVDWLIDAKTGSIQLLAWIP